jgi:hypothetical protein
MVPHPAYACVLACLFFASTFPNARKRSLQPIREAC